MVIQIQKNVTDKKERKEKYMEKLNSQELITVKGGALSSSMLNAIARTISTLFNVGQAVGSAIRRAMSRSYC